MSTTIHITKGPKHIQGHIELIITARFCNCYYLRVINDDNYEDILRDNETPDIYTVACKLFLLDKTSVSTSISQNNTLAVDTNLFILHLFPVKYLLGSVGYSMLLDKRYINYTTSNNKYECQVTPIEYTRLTNSTGKFIAERRCACRIWDIKENYIWLSLTTPNNIFNFVLKGVEPKEVESKDEPKVEIEITSEFKNVELNGLTIDEADGRMTISCVENGIKYLGTIDDSNYEAAQFCTVFTKDMLFTIIKSYLKKFEVSIDPCKCIGLKYELHGDNYIIIELLPEKADEPSELTKLKSMFDQVKLIKDRMSVLQKELAGLCDQLDELTK